MRRRAVTWRGLLVLVAVVLMIVVPLALLADDELLGSAVKVASLASFFVGLVVLILTMGPTAASRPDLSVYRTDLLTAVRRQWRAAQLRHRLQDPMPIPVRWRRAGPNSGVQDHWANVAIGSHGDTTVPMSGTVDGLAHVFRNLPSRRLTILGAPGAGKSTALLQLVLRLGDENGPDGPVPVLLSIGSWDPAEHTFHDWLSKQLAVEYSALGARFNGGTIATALVEAGAILPVLDGLDEMPPPAQALAIRQLNASLHLGDPVILTCRTDEYKALVATADMVTAAAVVELQPLGIAEISAYLPRTTRPGPNRTTKWDAPLGQLQQHPQTRQAAAVLSALGTPLMTSLARETYSDTDADPIRLLAGDRFPTAAHVSGHLLDMALPSAYPDGPHAKGRFQARSARRWLVYLAGWLHRAGSHELAWWRISEMIPAGWIAAGGALVGGVTMALLALSAMSGAAWLVAFTVTGAAIGAVIATHQQSVPSTARWNLRHGATRLRGAIGDLWQVSRLRSLTWIAWAIGLTAVIVLAGGRGGWWGMLLGVTAVVLTRALDAWFEVPIEVTSVPDPRRLLRTDRTTALIRGTLRGTIIGVTTAFLVDPATGVGIGSAVLTVSVGFTAWWRYVMVRTALAIAGRLPWRLLTFLDDATNRGVLRQTGAVYQFRHAQVRDRLADWPVELSAPPSSHAPTVDSPEPVVTGPVLTGFEPETAGIGLSPALGGPADLTSIRTRQRVPATRGAAKVYYCRHLGGDWSDLANYLDIKPYDQAKFHHGREPADIWDWLDARSRLPELPRALRAIDREEIADVVGPFIT